MKIVIRSSFTKASKKLPAHYQQKIAEIIAQIEDAKNIWEISNCKNSLVIKLPIELNLKPIASGFFTKKE